MKIATLVFLLAASSSFLSCSGSDASTASECRPSFREVSPGEVVTSELGSWQIDFQAALIGCADDLLQLSDRQMNQILVTLKDPSDWSNLSLMTDGKEEEFRSLVTEKLESIAGPGVVTDVHFHDITLFDHNEL